LIFLSKLQKSVENGWVCDYVPMWIPPKLLLLLPGDLASVYLAPAASGSRARRVRATASKFHRRAGLVWTRLLDRLRACGAGACIGSDDAACAGRFATSHGREYDAPRSRVTASKIRPSRWSITRLTTYTPSQHESHNSQRHKLDIRLSIWPPTLMWGDQITQLKRAG